MSRRAFTLVELVVVTGIVLVGLAVLIPKLLETREEARKASCQARLGCIGRGVLQFEASNKRLPAGVVISPPGPDWPNCITSYGVNVANCYDWDGRRGGASYSWMVLTLPYIGEQKLGEQFDLNRTIYTLPTRPYEQRVESFICPSATSAHVPYNGAGSPLANGLSFAKGNYAAYVSPIHLNLQYLWPAALGGFTPGEITGQRLAQIDDASFTLLATEVRNLDRAWDVRGAWAVSFIAANTLALDIHPIRGPPLSKYVPDPNYPDGMLPNRTTAPIRDQVPQCAEPAYAAQRQMPCATATYLASAPRSDHPGGVFAVYISGHVYFLLNDIDPIVMAALVSTNDGLGQRNHQQRP